MSKQKPVKYIHATPEGRVFKRSSARAYTHVLLCRLANPQALIASYEAQRPEQTKQATKSAKHYYNMYMSVMAAGIGGTFTNSNGYTRPVDEFDMRAAREHLAEHATLEQAIENCVAEYMNGIDKNIERVRAESTEWVVVSWHHSAALARPKYERVGEVFKVEAINMGVRS